MKDLTSMGCSELMREVSWLRATAQSWPLFPGPQLNTLVKAALDKWPHEAQWRMVMEECCELGAAVNHFLRGRIDAEAVAEEVADVYILLAQAERLLPQGVVEQACERKLARLEKRLAGDDEENPVV